MSRVELILGDCRSSLAILPDQYVQTCITSPPYFGLRDYGVDGQLGLELTPAEFVQNLVLVFREVRRVLRDDGTLWLNLGDSYSAGGRGGGADGSKQRTNVGAVSGDVLKPFKVEGYGPKQLLGIPWRVAFALQADGWFLRQDIIWHKPNPMPESVTDRCTKAHEYLFLLSKSPSYYFDRDAMQEPAQEWTGRAATFDRSGNGVAEHVLPGQSAAQHRPRPSKKRGEFNGKTEALQGRNAFRAVRPTRNKRSVWTVAPSRFKGAHFATFPPALIEPCVRAGAPFGGRVLDVFNGSGTTGEVAILNGRDYTGLELNPEYMALTRDRLALAQEEILW